MQPLTTLDTMIFSLDHEKFPMHGLAILVLDPTTSPEPFTYEHLLEHVRGRLPKMAPLRRRLVTTPLGLSPPLWVDDPDFDIRRHIHRATLPAPGTDRELAKMADDIADVPVDWDRPLWDMWFVDGLANGMVGYILKLHHCTSDILSGNDMMFQLFSLQPEALGPRAPDPWVPERLPSFTKRLGVAAAALLRLPFVSARSSVNLAAGLYRARRRGEASVPSAKLFSGPRMPFNVVPAGTPHRCTAWTSIPMEDVQAIRRRHGGTVNDVGLALYAGALRRWLDDNGILPARPLLCSMAKNVRPDAEVAEVLNVFDLLTLSLPTSEGDAGSRLKLLSDITAQAKGRQSASNTNIVENAMNIVPPGAMKGLIKLGIAVLGRRMPTPYNTAVTSLRAADAPMYLAGARLEHYYVQVMPSLGMSLMCAVVTYDGTMYVSVVSHRENTPDLWPLLAEVDREVEMLLQC